MQGHTVLATRKISQTKKNKKNGKTKPDNKQHRRKESREFGQNR